MSTIKGIQRCCALADRGGGKADGRIDTPGGRVQHHEAVAAARRAITGSGGAGGSGFQFGGRVGTGGDGLLQLGNRRRGLFGGGGQVGGGVRHVGAPLGVAAQVQRASVSQLQAHCARQARINLVARKQAITLNQNTACPFRRNNEHLTNNAFDDGNNIAH
ncbi:hypothetical protein [Pseudomonas sp. 44 R 15]|nr:hypothetical protein [Pseudomonas sp. 44 R 15]